MADMRAGRAPISRFCNLKPFWCSLSSWFPLFLHSQPKQIPKARKQEGGRNEQILTEYPCVPGPYPGHFTSIILFNLHNNPRRGYCYHSHAIDEETGSEVFPVGKLFIKPLLSSQEMPHKLIILLFLFLPPAQGLLPFSPACQFTT